MIRVSGVGKNIVYSVYHLLPPPHPLTDELKYLFTDTTHHITNVFICIDFKLDGVLLLANCFNFSARLVTRFHRLSFTVDSICGYVFLNQILSTLWDTSTPGWEALVYCEPSISKVGSMCRGAILAGFFTNYLNLVK